MHNMADTSKLSSFKISKLEGRNTEVSKEQHGEKRKEVEKKREREKDGMNEKHDKGIKVEQKKGKKDDIKEWRSSGVIGDGWPEFHVLHKTAEILARGPRSFARTGHFLSLILL